DSVRDKESQLNYAEPGKENSRRAVPQRGGGRMPHIRRRRFYTLQNRAAVLLKAEGRRQKAEQTRRTEQKKETVETGRKTEYTVGSMNAQLANSYYWYRFTWHPSGWRGASL